MQYSTSDAAHLLGISPYVIRTFVNAGLIRPNRGARRQFLFTFQDLILLRTAAALRKANISGGKTLRTLRNLRKQLPHGRELSEVRIAADGSQIVVQDGSTSWHPDSGQVLIDFNVAELAARAEPIARRRFDRARDCTALEWFDIAVDLEAVAPDQAREAYQHVLELDPRHADAHVNLGRLLHDDGQASEAATHYLQALRANSTHATAAFNLGVAMEDLGRISEAVRAYRQCISADGEFADAHYNLGTLLDRLGDERGAIRHLTKYRRLQRLPTDGSTNY